MTKQITVRVPDALDQFVKDRAESTHSTSTSVVIAALKAELRRCEIEHEIAMYEKQPDDDFAVLSQEQLAEVYQDLD